MDAVAWQRELMAELGDAEAAPILTRAGALAADAADPVLARRDVRSFLLTAGRPAATLRQFAADPLALELLIGLGGISRFGIEIALRWPGLFWELVQERQFRQVWGRSTMAATLSAEWRSATGDEARQRLLVRCKERHLLRLILGDLSLGISFEALVAELSDLADVLVQAALSWAVERLSTGALAPGETETPPGFVVLAMGKLGGRELNYSSDIDLIFVYEERGAAHDCHAYCQKLGAELVRIVDEATSCGRLFRVDMRLRPEGARGELALSARETIDYYYSAGRPWERQAAIKARPIAGDLALGERLLDELRPWVYPQEGWAGLDSTRDIRRRIEERLLDDDVKAGAGGIRDIEFLAQFLQLQHGGANPALRARATLPALRALADHGILPREHARELETHYLWLRLIEHRLQVWEDRQLHVIPRAPVERAALARRCGVRGVDALLRFDARLTSVRERVRAYAERYYLAGSRQDDARLALLTLEEPSDDLIKQVLADGGFKDRRRAAAKLRALAVEPFFLLSRSRTERSLATLLPRLLEGIARSPDPDETLDNFARIVSAVGGRATFYELLITRPTVLRMFLDIAGWSTFLVNLLQDLPGLPDDVVDALNQRGRGFDELALEARTLARGLNNPGEPLRYFQARELAVIAARDLEGAVQADINHRLSDLARAVLGAVLERCIAARARESGLPVAGGRQTRFAVLGLGKLGSRELSYASDMDVIFVCDPGGTCRSDGRDGEEFWTKVAQDLIRLCREGHLYEVDPRLRPWGEKGELVSSLPSLTNYWREPRDLWERMAMLRVAPVAGDPSLGRECADLIRRTALTAPLPGDALTQVRDMRRRLEASVAGRDHLKRGAGGYVDHEFIAHWLSFAVALDQLPPSGAIADTIIALVHLGRIPAAAAEKLGEGLALLRFVEARMRLTAGKAVSSIPQPALERTALAKRCAFPDLASFDLALHLAREAARMWFERLIA